VVSNTEGRISFAMAGPGTRTTQLFVNLADNTRLDSMGFAPVAEVTEGMDVVRSLYSGYGEGAPRGNGPNQGTIQQKGNEYLRESFPELDYITKATIET
jgi:peptidyl-prolyl cis-trans isomerase A (cyclophilin A)